ncbi:hypothetical protein BN970_01383 [Mycolicibacterium conceptionense]|uniref:Uncharacterized protein n=1 Tax=Mycolicibacterium conceptionense TaxID=451644 RepID=A0A0U1D3B7_9MYCO|nr:hypothetical protein [Mycolicibacterium conceptionense]ORV20973.1 hypothetical protein AWB98_01360 [Mycolicibacterium conceptionense]CQD07338.1 hypothetical protein BN970_01383 [Mycolicibacterium conceptionense]
MAEFTQTVTVKVWHIGTVADRFDEWADLVQWASETDGMAATQSAQADGGIKFQVEGRAYATVHPTEDSYVTFNGFGFEHLTPAEFQVKYPD